MDSSFSSPRMDSFPAGLRVLVVDDDLAWLRILEKMLKKCSYEATGGCMSMKVVGYGDPVVNIMVPPPCNLQTK